MEVMEEKQEGKEKKERMTYKDHVRYIEKVRPVLVMEQEILKSDERKKALFTFRQMKKKGQLSVVPTPDNNWAVAPSMEYSVDILKYEGVDFEQLKEELRKEEEEMDLEDALEEEERRKEREAEGLPPEEPDELCEEETEEETDEDEEDEPDKLIELLDQKKDEELSKKRIQSIETYKKYKEWLDKVRPVLMRARKIKEGERYNITINQFDTMKHRKQIAAVPSSKNNWSIEFTDSFLETEQLKESYLEQRKMAEEQKITPTNTPPAKPKPKAKARSNNSKRKQEFIKLAMTAGMTAEEAEEYWKRER